MDILFILATIMRYAFPSLHSMNYAYVVIINSISMSYVFLNRKCCRVEYASATECLFFWRERTTPNKSFIQYVAYLIFIYLCLFNVQVFALIVLLTFSSDQPSYSTTTPVISTSYIIDFLFYHVS